MSDTLPTGVSRELLDRIVNGYAQDQAHAVNELRAMLDGSPYDVSSPDRERCAALEAALRRVVKSKDGQFLQDGDHWRVNDGVMSMAERVLREKPLPPVVSRRLTVWQGPMPESNGKSNFTVILHRVGECVSKGITVYRSEYPDRARYEADTFRYLVGEIRRKPWITNYDADKHSGYVAPPALPTDAERLLESTITFLRHMRVPQTLDDAALQVMQTAPLFAEHKRITGQPCCEVTDADRALLSSGDYRPEELYGTPGRPSCPNCHKRKFEITARSDGQREDVTITAHASGGASISISGFGDEFMHCVLEEKEWRTLLLGLVTQSYSKDLRAEHRGPNLDEVSLDVATAITNMEPHLWVGSQLKARIQLAVLAGLKQVTGKP